MGRQQSYYNNGIAICLSCGSAAMMLVCLHRPYVSIVAVTLEGLNGRVSSGSVIVVCWPKESKLTRLPHL
eukprot:scaffold352918_cov18-Prasinocladus_malaysianus.AAC.1